MVKTIEGQLVASGKRFGLVAGRFNEFITKKLLEGAVDTLTRHGVKEEEIEVVWVPGSFEIPYAARKMAEGGKYHAVICLGAVIRGDTPHFDYIAGEVAKGVAQTALRTGVPTIFGVITADTLEQAIERAGTKSGNKGRDAALAAIEMVNLFEEMGKKR
ncbi:6,7-dimethyl-8-ribityllumazine synthase [candidate division NPL-UPA2 bacterium]|nr:6,7-dimethyl-8-ribityllumazine synthase [candidate division NPL-UPA2 bacterium]